MTAPTVTALHTACGHCHEPVIRTVGLNTSRLVQLEPTPEQGGLFELVPSGDTLKAVRRNIIHVSREVRGIDSYGGGHSQHRCRVYRY